MLEDFAEDYCRGGFWYAVKQVIVRFRWRHHLLKTKELWLGVAPLSNEKEIHSCGMNVCIVDSIVRILNLGTYPDFIDENVWFEAALVYGSSGFSKDELDVFNTHSHLTNNSEKDRYLMLPVSVLDKISKTPKCEMTFLSTNRREIPNRVIIHYGKDEKPFWLEEWFIKSHTDQAYFPTDPSDPFGNSYKQNRFY